jgi:hypothetical protein
MQDSLEQLMDEFVGTGRIEWIGIRSEKRAEVVSGINLLALKNKSFQLCATVLEYTSLCYACSRMAKKPPRG